MAKTSFAQKKAAPSKKQVTEEVESEIVEDTPQEDSPKEAAPAAVTTREHNPPATVPTHGGIAGEVTEDDIKLPYLQLVQATSEISDEFPQGSIVIDKEEILCDDENAVELVVLHGEKLYQQKLPFGEADESPVVLPTRAAVREWGGTCEYSQEAIDDQVYFENLAHFVVAVKCPEGASAELESRFDTPFEDELWARFKFSVRGSGFTSFGKTIITMAQTAAADGGIWTRLFELRTKKKSNAKGRWFVPVPRLKKKLTGEEEASRLEFLTELAAPFNE